MMILTGRTVSSALRPPYPYGGEFVSQFLFTLRLVLASAAGLDGRDLLWRARVAGGELPDGVRRARPPRRVLRAGGVREIGPLITAIVLAGVAGTAITADLGARKIREELDALQVLGVDPVKNLVVPRFLALMLVTGLFNIYAILFGIFGGMLAAVVNGQPLGPFWATFFANTSTTDLWGSVLKTTMFGAIIAIVCCYKGMTASGGAEGVGRAVNQAVVDLVPRDRRVQLRLHADAARHPPQHPRRSSEPARRNARANGSPRRARSASSCGDVIGRRVEAARAALLRRGAPPGRHPDRLLDPRDLGARVHHRARHVRHRGRLLHRGPGRPVLRGRVHRLVRSARGRPLRVRLHDGRQGRHRHRRRARRDAHQRGDRRAGGDGRRLDDVPLRHAPARRLDRAPVHVHRRRSASPTSPPTSRW